MILTSDGLDNDGETMISVELDINYNSMNTVPTEVIYVKDYDSYYYADYGYSFKSKTNIKASAFTENTVMSFNIETTGMGSSSEITQAVADLSGAEVRLAMAGFNVLLYKNGFTVADLGFTSW